MSETLLIAALTLVLVTTVALSILVGLTVRIVVRNARVHPSVETGVPLHWAWWPGRAAHCHRRLRGAVADIVLSRRRWPPVGSRVEGEEAPAGELGRALVAEAVSVDRELLLAARLPSGARRSAIRSLRADVDRIDRLGRAFRREGPAAAASDMPLCGPERQAVLDAIELRLRHLHEAHEELRAIEAESAPGTAPSVPARPGPDSSRPDRSSPPGHVISN